MNDKTRHQMSAFLDDELPEHEAELLLRRLQSDDGLQTAAEHYLLIGQALRGERSAGVFVRERVARALEDEAAYSRPAETMGSRWVRPVAGVAVAASVAVVALMGLQQSGDPDAPVSISADSSIGERSELGLDSSPADFEYTVPSDIRSGQSRLVAVPARLTNYMISHGEQAGTLARSGMHGRIVTQRIGAPTREEEPAKVQPAENAADATEE